MCSSGAPVKTRLGSIDRGAGRVARSGLAARSANPLHKDHRTMEPGKQIRWGRLFKHDPMVIVPFDHGMLNGPMPGIEDPVALVRLIRETPVDAIMLTPWLLAKISHAVGNLGIIVRLNGARSRHNPDLFATDRICTVERAARLGADAVVADCYIGGDRETQYLNMIATIACECATHNVLMVAETIPARVLASHVGQTERDDSPEARVALAKDIAMVSRMGLEHGADLIKTYYPMEPDLFRQAVQSAMVPMVMAGGPAVGDRTDRQFLAMVKDSLGAGARGICMGRSVWGHANPRGMMRALCALAHDGADVDTAMACLDA